VYINASGTDYQLYIIEKQIMEQVIQASEMLQAINANGFIALDILFDTGKSTIKKESIAIIEQIYEMLRTNASLKVSIEGHTDNTGTPAGNKSLSESRAKAVMDVLVAKGIDKSRLFYKGWGEEKPVADNRTEEGKAKNRRVEIIKIK
jgi:OmpA-OmpF porin, OOP family